MSKKQRKPKQPRTKHGVYFWLDSGRINPSIRGFKKLQQYLEDLEAGLIRSLGGPDKVSPGQEILVKATVEAYGVIVLASMYTKKEGVLRPDMLKRGVVELQPVLGKQFLSFLNTIRLNLTSLNLNQAQAEEVLNLNEYIKSKYGGKDETSD